MPSVQRYFDSQANNYQSDSERFPWSSLRRAEARAFLDAIGSNDGKDVLELGCGAGYYSRLLAECGVNRLHAVDLSPKMLDTLHHPRIDKHCADATTVKIDQTFQVIISAGLLEFVPDPLAVLKNARAHSTDDGQLTILFPFQCLAGKAYQATHKTKSKLPIRLFRSEEMTALAQQAGWRKEYETNCALFSCVMRFQATKVVA